MIPDLAALLIPKTAPVPAVVEAQSWPDAFAAFLQELAPEIVPETEPEALPETEVPAETVEVPEVQPRFQTVTELQLTMVEPQPEKRPELPDMTDATVEDGPMLEAPKAPEAVEQPVVTQTAMPPPIPVTTQLTQLPLPSVTTSTPVQPKPETTKTALAQPALAQPRAETLVPQFVSPETAATIEAAPVKVGVDRKPIPTAPTTPSAGEFESPLPEVTKAAHSMVAKLEAQPTPIPFVHKAADRPQSNPAPEPIPEATVRVDVASPEPFAKTKPKDALTVTPPEPQDIAEITPTDDPTPPSIQPTVATDRPIHQSERTHTQPHIEPRQIAQQLAVVVREQPEGVTEIALSPDELGSVKMQVTVQNDSVTVVIAAEKPETGELMRRHLDTLSQEFRDLGYRDVNLGFSQGSRQQTPQGQPAAVTEPEPEPETQTAPTDGVDIRL